MDTPENTVEESMRAQLAGESAAATAAQAKAGLEQAMRESLPVAAPDTNSASAT